MSNKLLLVKPNNTLDFKPVEKNFIRQIRKENQLTLEQLAERIGTTNQQISYLESGKRRLTWEWIRKIANALECHPTDITQGPGSVLATETDIERQLLESFRGLAEPEKNLYLHTIKSYSDSKKTTAKNREERKKS